MARAGIVVGFGYYGAKRLFALPLVYYIFGNVVFTIMSAVAFVSSLYLTFHDSNHLVSLAVLGLQIVSTFNPCLDLLLSLAPFPNHPIFIFEYM